MKTIFTVFVILAAQLCNGQKWNFIPGSKILLADLTEFKADPFYKSKYDYFKKGDSVIVIDSTLKTDFYNLFVSFPNSFDSLFKYAHYKTEIDKGYLGFFDKILLHKIVFAEAAIFTNKDLVREGTQLKWILKNISWNSFPQLYCTNFVFFDLKKESETEINQPVFIKVTYEYCIL